MTSYLINRNTFQFCLVTLGLSQMNYLNKRRSEASVSREVFFQDKSRVGISLSVSFADTSKCRKFQKSSNSSENIGAYITEFV